MNKGIPVLTGKIARRFEKIIKENETNRVSAEEYQRIRAVGEKIRIFNSMTEYRIHREGDVNMINENRKLKAVNAALLECLQWYVDNDDTNNIATNQYWLDGLERAKLTFTKAKALVK